MPNAITLAQQFVPLLDETYQLASLTADLDGNADLVRQGANANELIIPMLSMQGLGDYSRNDGYVKGDVTLTNETVKCNFDRGRMFTVDTMDNLETAGIAFGQLAGEFIRTKVAPEEDAFRFAQYAGKTGISKVGCRCIACGWCSRYRGAACRHHQDGRGRGARKRALSVHHAAAARLCAGYGHHQEPRGHAEFRQGGQGAAEPLLHCH